MNCIPSILLMVSLFVPAYIPAEQSADDVSKENPEKNVEKVMGISNARHLLDRTCFGASPQEIIEYAFLTKTEAIQKLLQSLQNQPSTDLPDWTRMSFSEIRALRKQDTRAFTKIQRGWQQEARIWWTNEMLNSPSPLTERLVLMWHGHFTSEMRTVKSPHAMLRQNQLFREKGAGNFEELLKGIATDSAMALYLDTQKSKKGKPNENFARELFELFSLGEGNYDEKDIKEAAKAFTGYRIRSTDGTVRKIPRLHDRTPKTVLGRSGRLDGMDVIDTILDKSACGEWIARRYWLEFISPSPDPAVIQRWGRDLKKSNWDLKKFLSQLLNSEQFWAEEYRGSLIKSPVDLVVGSLRRMEIREIPGALLQRTLMSMGQILFDPPNVAGWPGGTAWIDSTTLLERRTFLESGLSNAMVLSIYQNETQSQPDQKDPEMSPEMDPEMDPEMSPEMSPGQSRSPLRLNRKAMRRYRPLAAQSLEKTYQRFIAGNSENELAWTLSWLPFQPVTTADQNRTGFGRLQEIILDPTYQLK